jgi:TRAP-type mannitol/chloroaromatic compound transport system substrate-binding protein
MRQFVPHLLRRAVALAAVAAFSAGAQAQTSLKMQATWPASLTLYENFTYFVDRIHKISGGQLKIDAMPAGQVVPAFEVLDATHKKVLDGAHAWSGYWVGKNKAAILCTGGPGGTFGMDMIDALGWMHHGGGIDLCNELFQKELKLNVHWIPILPSGPQAFGWFKRPIKNLADFKGMKCRQTGMAAEVWQRMGMQTVNMPGGEIIPSAQRGVIDCAEWVGGVEDLRLGFHNVWKAMKPEHQEMFKTVASETFVIWWAKWQRQNADAIKELQEKHGVRILRTPGDILVEFLKTWDKIAEEEGAKSPFFKKTHDSQRQYASLVVPAKRFMFPPYSFVANYYWPEGGAKSAAKGEGAKAEAKKK